MRLPNRAQRLDCARLTAAFHRQSRMPKCALMPRCRRCVRNVFPPRQVGFIGAQFGKMNRNIRQHRAAKKPAAAAVVRGKTRLFARPTIGSVLKSAYPHCPISMRVCYHLKNLHFAGCPRFVFSAMEYGGKFDMPAKKMRVTVSLRGGEEAQTPLHQQNDQVWAGSSRRTGLLQAADKGGVAGWI